MWFLWFHENCLTCKDISSQLMILYNLFKDFLCLLAQMSMISLTLEHSSQISFIGLCKIDIIVMIKCNHVNLYENAIFKKITNTQPNFS